MASAAGSLFARTYAGHTGVDPYTTAVSDVYQDLFDEGIFTGKGLYDVDAFAAALEGRVPENALLSHDLFEGLYARTALVTDVEVVDDYPSSVLAHARRQHRWVRGDWQILLVAVSVRADPHGPAAQSPAAHLALEDPRQPAAQPDGAGDGRRCSCSAGRSCRAAPVAWTAIGLAALAFPLCLRLLELLGGPTPLAIGTRVPAHRDRGSRDRRRPRRRCSSRSSPTRPTRCCTRSPSRSCASGSRKHRLLEWETAAASADRGGPPRLSVFVKEMIASPLIAVGGLAAGRPDPSAARCPPRCRSSRCGRRRR